MIMALDSIRRLLQFPITPPAWSEVPSRDLYAALWSYYHSNGLYDSIQRAFSRNNYALENMKPLRNPANRAVEFYAVKLWPKNIQIDTKNEAIREPLEQVWKWSNWGTQRYFAARQLACTGDLFIKTVTTPVAPIFPSGPSPKVYFEVLKSEVVTDFQKDPRGFLTFCRIDVPITIDTITGSVQRFHTEAWDQFRVRIWPNHDKTPETALEQLGTPVEIPLETYGIDFIPIVHAKFRDVGTDRGQGCFVHAIDKIDEVNRMATRLHSLLFRYNAPMWALTAGGMDSSGRPLPAPRLMNASGQVTDTLEINDDTVLRFSGNGDIKALVAGVDWTSHLNSIAAQMKEVEEDLPELAYYRLREMSQISGRAVQYLLSDAIERAIQARDLMLDAFKRADEMALTIGTAVKAFNVEGKFDNGDWEHTFVKEDIFPQNSMEIAEAERTDADAKSIKNKLGVPKSQLQKEMGYTDEEIAKFKKESEQETKDALALLPPPISPNGNGNPPGEKPGTPRSESQPVRGGGA